MLSYIPLAALAASYASASTIPFLVDKGGYINYTTVAGYFLQDEASTDASTFDYTAENFGLINRTYPATEFLPGADLLTQWQKFELQVALLNAEAPLDTTYKVLFLGRHGQGYHNAAQTFYGTPAWNCFWAELKGNATVTWDNAELTPTGVEQAEVAHDFWAHEIAVQKIQTPQSYYTSPLDRCLSTAEITFGGLALPAQYPFIPTVKEFLRETISIHTCDHRGNLSEIEQNYPSYKIESGFNEYDELWNGITAESDSAHQKRMLTLLDEVFTTDANTVLSFTSHSGSITTLLEVIGHQAFALATGAVLPVLVKAEYLPASEAPVSSVGPFTTSTWCHNAPPITSIGSLSQGCVCEPTTAPLPSLNTQPAFIPGQTAPLNEYTTTTTIKPTATARR